MLVYFALFIITSVLLLWLFEIVLLDTSYKMIKQREVKSSAAKIVEHIDNRDYIEKLALTNDLSVMVVDSEGKEVVSSVMTPRSTVHHMTDADIQRLYEKSVENGGEYMNRSGVREEIKKYRFGERSFSKPENLIYTRVVSSDSSFKMVIVESVISPVNATIDTLRFQLVIITVLLLVIAGVLALYYSRRIAGPIEEVTRKARALGEGRYEPEEFDGGYREINQLVETLDYANEEIQKTDNYRRELMANVSHDLRTPLTMIIGYSEMMRDYPDHIDEESVQIIIDEAKRLSTLVNDTLDLAKYESGTVELKKKRFSLTEQTRQIIGRVSGMTEFEIVFEPDEEAYVEADELQMSQVIYNLVANAINYSGDEKRIEIRQSTADGRVRIEIIDFGEGIAKDKLDDIWDRYYKVDRTHRRSVIGTGLGLSIVKTILERHSADFGVESEEGKGSNFWFELDTVK